MDGIIPLLKPKGMTSHDCVFKLRKILKTKKVGHTGTLDPEVTGVLPICIGRATKVAEYITDAGKEYIGEVTLGYSTTTEDAYGEVVEQKKVEKDFTLEEIKTAMNSFLGEITQIPPMYSAVKVNGKKLYEYARLNQEVERPKRNVVIYELELLELNNNSLPDTFSFSFRVKCSKGTYIRTLAVQIGEKLGYPAHMSSLERTQSANFTLTNSYTLEQIANAMEEGTIDQLLYPLEEGVNYLPSITVDETTEAKVLNGMRLSASLFPEEKPLYVVYNTSKIALAIYVPHPEKEGLYKPQKVLKI